MKRKLFFIVAAFALLVCAGIFLRGAYTVPVLMYHSINRGGEHSRLVVAPESFQRQMRFLREQHYRVLALEDYVRLMKQGEKPARKSVVITFDDGYADNYFNAYPVLKRCGFPATIFAVPQWVGTKDMADWRQLEEMISGGITIGSHGLSHCELTNIAPEEAEREIVRSKRELEERLGVPVNYFCYPCGFLNPALKQMVIKAGYRGACATRPGKHGVRNDIFAIRRIRISRSADNLFIFRAQVSGYYNLLRDYAGKYGKIWNYETKP